MGAEAAMHSTDRHKIMDLRNPTTFTPLKANAITENLDILKSATNDLDNGIWTTDKNKPHSKTIDVKVCI